jgi:hypothetical protein
MVPGRHSGTTRRKYLRNSSEVSELIGSSTSGRVALPLRAGLKRVDG